MVRPCGVSVLGWLAVRRRYQQAPQYVIYPVFASFLRGKNRWAQRVRATCHALVFRVFGSFLFSLAFNPLSLNTPSEPVVTELSTFTAVKKPTENMVREFAPCGGAKRSPEGVWRRLAGVKPGRGAHAGYGIHLMHS